MGPLFFYPRDNHTNGMIFLLHLGPEGITEIDTDPKGRFVSIKVTPSYDTVLCLCLFKVQHQGAAGWGRGAFSKDFKIIWKLKLREMKTK